MPLDYEKLRAVHFKDEAHHYDEKDAILYALSVGFGADASDRNELGYVCECLEGGLKTVPTLATVLVRSAGAIDTPGINHELLVHGDQRLRIDNPLPPEADVLADTRVVEIFDKGADKGALLLVETKLRLEDDTPLATSTTGLFLRGDGGFGGPKDGAPRPHAIPECDPDFIAPLHTTPNQALLYRLNSDRNPLHVDPDFAARAGFDRPILHGLCSYGIACRGLIQHVCNYDAWRIREFDARFSAPVFPGDVLEMEFWHKDETVSFRVRNKESKQVVINNGRCLLGG
ncbi:MAG: MaoC/PaaZ C-terminal domain-containing protein [Hyphomicrobiales bacterium]|nr:MaoC/PaaZ C-terminal domain-containing protein [Hyphomicrobiales bacterium]